MIHTASLSQTGEAAQVLVVTHLHGLAVEEVNVRLLLVRTLADQQEEGWEVFFCVNGVAAVDGLERILLQFILHKQMNLKVIMHENMSGISKLST